MKNLYNTSTKTIIFEYNQELDEQWTALKNLFRGGKSAVRTGGKAATKANVAGKVTSSAKNTANTLDDLLSRGKITADEYKILGGQGAAAADDIILKYRTAMSRGWKTALPTPKFHRIITRRQWPEGVWRWFRGMPLPKGEFKAIRQSLGLGPAMMAVGTGLIKQYIVLCIWLTVFRTLSQLIEHWGLTSWGAVNRIFGIEKYETSPWGGGWVGDLFYNIVFRSSYAPNLFILLRGWKAVPYFLTHSEEVFDRINSIGSFGFGATDTQTAEEAFGVDGLSDAESMLENDRTNIVNLTNTIPEDLLEKIPSSQRNKVKMNQDIVYFGSPEYEIRKVNNQYIMLIPGDGWYRVQDLNY